MNFALIFAAGIGCRMNSEIPKQFLLVNNKPILVYTLEKFQNSHVIDRIVVVTLCEFFHEIDLYIKRYNLTKVFAVIAGGNTAFESQKIGIKFLKNISTNSDDIVYIHDGVRPFINNDLLEKCLKETIGTGSAITITPAFETVAVLGMTNKIDYTIPRQNCVLARAPQVFYLNDIYEAHLLAEKNSLEYVDSASMLLAQGKNLNYVEGPIDNIKITTQFDYAICQMMLGGNKHE